MNDLKGKYSIFEKIYNGPKAQGLMKCREEYKMNPNNISNIDDILLNNAILYFGTKYVDKVKEILGDDNGLKLKFEDVYSDEMIKVISETSLKTKDAILIKYRDYQILALKFLEKNRGGKNLVIMPTGYGKTIIAFNEIIEQLKLGKNAVFSAPTNALVEQQYNDFIDYTIYVLDDQNISNSTSLGLKNEDSKVYFVTNHALDRGIENKLFDENTFYIVDEAHEGEGKEGDEDREYKYPTMQAFEKLDDDNYSILALSATPTNFPILEEKLGIENVFYGSDEKYFVHKSRKILFSDHDINFEHIYQIINSKLIIEIENILKYIQDYKNSDSYDKNNKKILSNYTKSKLSKKNYFDHNLINKLGEVFDKKVYPGLFSSLWNYKKLLEIKKQCFVNEYNSLQKYIEKELSIDSKEKLKNLLAKKSEFDKLLKNETDIKKTEKIKNNISIVISKLSKLSKEINRKNYLLGKNYIIKNTIDDLYTNLLSYNYNNIIHPKVNTLFEILNINKFHYKTIVVHIENDQVIKHILNLALRQGFSASYLKGGAKNKTNTFIDNYTKENIRNNKLDVVFVTSVFKLGVNFDIDNLIFYHPPKNIKDLLQFEGRVGRYSKNATVYYLGIEGGFESTKVFIDISRAKKYLNNQFLEAENSKEFIKK